MKFSNIAELLLLAAVWGGSFLFMRIAAPIIGPVWLIEIRVLLAGLIMLLVVTRQGQLYLLRKYWFPLAVVGCINSAIPFVFLAFASVYLPAGFTSILNGTAPLFGMIVASVWLNERLTPTRLIGFALGFVGVVLLVGLREVAVTSTFFLAVSAGLMAAIMYAIAAPYIKQQMTGVPSFVTTTGSQLAAALVLVPLLPFTIPQNPITPPVIIAVLALALLSTALAYVLYFRLIQNVGSTKALTVTYLIPFFAMLWGALILKEPITSSMIGGCALVLLGTAIVNDVLTSRFNHQSRDR
ncbi:MAG: DMT family transporter [Cyanobacteria bacterium J06627_8]